MWHNFRGLLDVVTYLAGPLGPLAPMNCVREVVQVRPPVDRESPTKYVEVSAWPGIEDILDIFYISRIEILRCDA